MRKANKLLDSEEEKRRRKFACSLLTREVVINRGERKRDIELTDRKSVMAMMKTTMAAEG